MDRITTKRHLGWIPPSGKRKIPIEVVAVYEKPTEEEQLEIDKKILECVLGVRFEK